MEVENPNAWMFDAGGRPRRLLWCSDTARLGGPCPYVGDRRRFRPEGGCCKRFRIRPTVVVNITEEKCDVYVGRPSKWRNPFHIGRDGTRQEVIELYRQHLLASTELLAALPELQGKRLGCFCAPLPCHADVLARLADMFAAMV